MRSKHKVFTMNSNSVENRIDIFTTIDASWSFKVTFKRKLICKLRDANIAFASTHSSKYADYSHKIVRGKIFLFAA